MDSISQTPNSNANPPPPSPPPISTFTLNSPSAAPSSTSPKYLYWLIAVLVAVALVGTGTWLYLSRLDQVVPTETNSVEGEAPIDGEMGLPGATGTVEENLSQELQTLDRELSEAQKDTDSTDDDTNNF